MLFARAFMGISEACYIPGALALITDYHKSRTRSFATGIHMSGLYAGLAMGAMGGYFAECMGWRFGFQQVILKVYLTMPLFQKGKLVFQNQ